MKYIKEYNSLGYYYDMDYSDRPPGVKAIERISIRDRTIAFIKSRLGITHNIHLDGRNASGGVGFCRFSYNVVTGEIGEIGEIKLGIRSRSVYIYEYEDEWFKVYIDDRMYWCDQVDSVVSCIRNMIDYEVSSHINESSNNNVYYQEISGNEFNNLLDGGVPREVAHLSSGMDNLTYTFGKGELLKLTELTGCTFRLVGGHSGFRLSFIINNMYGVLYRLKDEWYLVDVVDNGHHYYKCDQMDGLIYFFKEIKKRKRG